MLLRAFLISFTLMGLISAPGCTPGYCERNTDCPAGQICNYYGQCKDPSPGTEGGTSGEGTDEHQHVGVCHERYDSPFSPDQVYLLGSVFPNLMNFDVVATLDDPHMAWVGFPEHLQRYYMDINGVLYYRLGRDYFRYVPDPFYSSSTVGCEYPSNVNDNDIYFASHVCPEPAENAPPNTGILPKLFQNPFTEDYVISCWNIIYDLDGNEVLLLDEDERLVTIGKNGKMLISSLDIYYIMDIGGNKVEIPDLARRRVVSTKNLDDGFYVVTRFDTNGAEHPCLWKLFFDGSSELLRDFPVIYNDISSTWHQPKVDAQGNVYVVNGTATAGDDAFVLRYSLNGIDEVVFSSLPENMVQIRSAILLSTP